MFADSLVDLFIKHTRIKIEICAVGTLATGDKMISNRDAPPFKMELMALRAGKLFLYRARYCRLRGCTVHGATI